jgi:hypothetical protein
MITERYISRTNTRIVRRGEKIEKYLDGGKMGTTSRSTAKATTASLTMKQTSTMRQTTRNTFKVGEQMTAYKELEQYT